MDDGNDITTRLLTLLNVSAIKTGKRKRTTFDDPKSLPNHKLNKRKSVLFADVLNEGPMSQDVKNDGNEKRNMDGEKADEKEAVQEPAIEEVETESHDIIESYERHFGVDPKYLTEHSRDAIDKRAWKLSKERLGKLGSIVHSSPEGMETISTRLNHQTIPILERLKIPFESRQAKQPKDQMELQNDLLSTLSTHQDLYLSHTTLDTQTRIQEAIMLHALDHVTKKRRRVLKNNERLSATSKTSLPPPEDILDQGFTRPSILLLLPFRSTALRWISALITHTPSPQYQIENHARFLSEYGLTEGASDKLRESEPGAWPRDHVEMFSGNCDDGFRLGVKFTRKSVKLFSEFYSCDLVLASPLGLRIAIEKEKNADFLSSIEIMVVDQMDALAMQNWEHVQFVFSHLNKLPKESRNTDFSRIKPWYLNGHAAYLRQTVLLSAYETPEMRALYHGSLMNVAGKIRTDKRWSAVSVPEGVDQNFMQFDCGGVKDEADQRFNYFTTQVLPTILKSAVQSANTAIFIPSSFDFIRVHNYFRQTASVNCAILSEYSSNQDISRARQAFFQGKKSFLLMSERFHFYKRYKIRGIRNLVFYAPPDHPQFYTELLSYPFLDEGVAAEDVSCRVIYSKLDWFRLERIAGSEGARELIKAR